jgi:hypothetical protein
LVSLWFDYGASTAYGDAHGSLAEQTSQQTPRRFTMSQTLTDLVPNTTYHFRAVGSDWLACRQVDGGDHCNTSYGSDMTFTTAPPPPTLAVGKPPATLAVAGPSAHLTRAFRARVRVICSSGAAVPCRGMLKMTRHRRTLGVARYSVAPGTSRTLRIQLNTLGRKLMRSHRRLSVRVSAAHLSPLATSIVLVRQFRIRRRS